MEQRSRRVAVCAAWLVALHFPAVPLSGQDRTAVHTLDWLRPRFPVVRSTVRAQPRFTVEVVGGRGAINNVGQAAQVIVVVRDRNNTPAAAVAVTFVLPDSEPGGVFPTGERETTVLTDATGRATAIWETRGVGPYEVRVEIAGALVASVGQTNAQGGGGGGLSTRAGVLLGIAGAAVVGIMVGVTRAGAANQATITGISLGLPTVGPPP